MEDKEIQALLATAKSEAVRNAIDAFNEGFLYGRQYAEKLYNSKSN